MGEKEEGRVGSCRLGESAFTFRLDWGGMGVSRFLHDRVRGERLHRIARTDRRSSPLSTPNPILTPPILPSGLPYLLQLPPNQALPTPSSLPPLSSYLSLRRAQSVQTHLTTLLQLLITYQPSAPAIAYGRAVLRPSSTSSSTTTPVVPPPVPAQAQAQVQGRRPHLSLTINLTALLALLVPLLLLSLKLGFLLWIFGRHVGFILSPFSLLIPFRFVNLI